MTCRCGGRSSASCSANFIEAKGEMTERIPNQSLEPCFDCGVESGGYHHMGCNTERCPICGFQMTSCYCWSSYLAIEVKRSSPE